MAYDKQSNPCISILPKKRNYFASLDKTLVEEKKKTFETCKSIVVQETEDWSHLLKNPLIENLTTEKIMNKVKKSGQIDL